MTNCRLDRLLTGFSRENGKLTARVGVAGISADSLHLSALSKAARYVSAAERG
jgi:hypothetical protein